MSFNFGISFIRTDEMGLHPPILRNLNEFSAADNNTEPNEVWNISAPEKNSLYWSILIPYLITSVENGTFLQNIKSLVGENPDRKIITKELNFGVIEKRVRNINPFINKHTLYFDENLITLMRVLKKRLNQIAGNLLNNSEGNYLKFEAAANMLTCNIDVYEENSNNKSLKSFKTTAISQKKIFLKIIIFSEIQSSKLVYGFGLGTNYSMNLQANSLKHILKTAGLQHTAISEIVKLLPCEHLLLTCLENSLGHVIPTLFKSPYILKKLGDAGYDINPLTTGEKGVSAFYYCILLNDWNLFRVLYKHASRKDYFLQENVPEDDILAKLTTLQKRIQCDFQSKDFPEFRSESKVQRMYNLLIQFSKYHIEIEEGVTSIRHDPKLQPGKKLNETVLFIINKYSEYFHYGAIKSERDKYEDFFQNFEYHKMVDDLTCFCFFDHFLSLKVKLDDRQKNIFIEVLASMFLYFLSKLKFHINIYFPDSTNFNAKLEAKYFLIFCYRMQWYKALSDLTNELNSGLPELKDSNIIKIVEKCLIKYPLIKEEFLLARLQMYLKIAEEADFTGNEIKAALAVLRTLQVIGETFRNTKIGCIITPLLQHCIPSNVAIVLRDTRDCLSHYHANCTQGRKELERNSFLLKIQRELKDVTEVFEPIFAMQTFRVSDFMITKVIEESRNFDSDLFKTFHDMKTEISDLKQEHYVNHEDKYISIANTMLNLLPESVENNEKGAFYLLQIYCESLKYLLLHISKHSNNCNIDGFVEEVEKIDKLYLKSNHGNTFEDSIKDIKLVLSELKQKFITEFDVSQRNSSEISFPNLNIIFKTIREFDIFPRSDQALIRKSFSDFLDTSKQQIIEHINGIRILSNDELDACLKCLINDKKVRTQIRKSMKNKDEVLKLLNDNICSLKNILGNEEETCCRLMTAVSDDVYRNAIPKLCLPKYIHDKLSSLKTQKLDFVLERMKYLEEILINDNDYIKNSRIYGTSVEYRDHTKRLIMLRYIAETDTKAALEMLLLDCLEIFKKREDFKNVCFKSTDIFLGISIRDTLSHGCPILEVSNDLLDDDNLPLEFINIALELIEDQKSLKTLIELSQKTGLPAKELQSFIENNSDDKFSELKKAIVKCDRWERYLFLFLN